jgi:S-disulfanyl-L-cysteine oxidoreductase SoxD
VRGLVAGLVFVLAAGGCGRGDRAAVRTGSPARYGFGRAATAADVSAWDIDVMPDGTGLPPGRGTVPQGAAIYAHKCAACHGRTGTDGPFDRLVGREPRLGFPFGRDPRFVKTLGNYWPYATTLYDYVNRAMPLDAPGSLTADEVYSLVAFLLWRNEIVTDTTVMNAHTLPQVVMPAHDRFVIDNRRGGPDIR